MKKRFVVCMLLAAVILPSAAKAFQSFFDDTPVQGWTVYGYDASCWMIRDYPDGTTLKFSRGLKNDLYLSVQNRRWTSIKADTRYDVNVSFDRHTVIENAGGHRGRSGPSFSFFFDDADTHYRALQTANVLSLARNGKPIGTYALSGALAATIMLEQCLTLVPRPSADPFVE